MYDSILRYVHICEEELEQQLCCCLQYKIFAQCSSQPVIYNNTVTIAILNTGIALREA